MKNELEQLLAELAKAKAAVDAYAVIKGPITKEDWAVYERWLAERNEDQR